MRLNIDGGGLSEKVGATPDRTHSCAGPQPSQHAFVFHVSQETTEGWSRWTQPYGLFKLTLLVRVPRKAGLGGPHTGPAAARPARPSASEEHHVGCNRFELVRGQQAGPGTTRNASRNAPQREPEMPAGTSRGTSRQTDGPPKIEKARESDGHRGKISQIPCFPHTQDNPFFPFFSVESPNVFCFCFLNFDKGRQKKNFHLNANS